MYLQRSHDKSLPRRRTCIESLGYINDLLFIYMIPYIIHSRDAWSVDNMILVVTTVPRMKKRTEADVNIAKAAGSIIGALIIAESTADETAGVMVANAISTKIRPRISRTAPANITVYRKIRTNQLPKVLNAVFAYSMEFWMFSLKPITIILTYQSFRLYMSSLTGLKKSENF